MALQATTTTFSFSAPTFRSTPRALTSKRRLSITASSSSPGLSSPPLLSLSRSNLKGRAFASHGSTQESPSVVCFGEMLIDFVPTTSGLSLAQAPAFKKAPGGAPANVAVGIARLGGSSAFIGKVGEDEFGYMLANILKDNNVNNEGMRFDPGARTALAFVTLTNEGEHCSGVELDEERLREALMFANACGALTVKERGAIPALPTKEAVLEALLKAVV
ncbi:hypothetical protein F2Q70_00044980 [Brassica cretica]|uniref:Carbohydrate kinase PfkB domain-containing protein n=1 Tax=Brassica cretica TaxID=69181 RepID=A0A8S9KCX5_BRACR|nr:hypothetical protein F2Q70_00044980 [Brassica cretica]